MQVGGAGDPQRFSFHDAYRGAQQEVATMNGGR